MANVVDRRPRRGAFRPDHVVPGAPFPTSHPAGFAPPADAVAAEPVFDPAIHLDLRPPSHLKPLISDHSLANGDHPVKFPLPAVRASPGGLAKSMGPGGGEVPFPGLAYSSSFRVLSDEGVRVLREIIRCNEHHAGRNDRQNKSMRGLGYRSKFVRDFTYCPQVLDFLAQMSGTPLHPHDMTMNVAQINFGEVGAETPVDRWHLDSVPYVMVVLLSDATGMEGGELRVARLPEPREAMRQVLEGSIDPQYVDTVQYPGPGHAILMQGSYIAHTATAVSKASEPRITLVNSYQPRNPFADVATCYRTFKLYDPDDVHPLDVARHYAWRAAGQLDYLLRGGEGLFETAEGGKLVSLLDGALDEIQRARDFITGDAIDNFPYSVDTDNAGYKELLRKKAEFARKHGVAARATKGQEGEQQAGEQGSTAAAEGGVAAAKPVSRL